MRLLAWWFWNEINYWPLDMENVYLKGRNINGPGASKRNFINEEYHYVFSVMKETEMKFLFNWKIEALGVMCLQPWVSASVFLY